jgi:rare lipoprotein A
LIGTRRANTYALVVLLAGLLAIPSIAWAAGGSGGSSGGSGGTSGSPNGGSGLGGLGSDDTIQPGNVIVTASSGGITLTTNASAMLQGVLSLTGTTSPSAAGETIEIERLGNETAWQWAPTVTATVAADGSFSAAWFTDHIGRFSIRAVLAQPAAATTAAAGPTVTSTVYRPSLATQYGPGFYGKRMACGGRLARGTIGVANRTLKCGEQVAIYYRGRVMIVPVIDRGPYANGADWDLTMATGRALGISGTAKIGAVSLPPQPVAPLTRGLSR